MSVAQLVASQHSKMSILQPKMLNTFGGMKSGGSTVRKINSHLHLAPSNTKLMQAEMLKYFDTPQGELMTTTEFKNLKRIQKKLDESAAAKEKALIKSRDNFSMHTRVEKAKAILKKMHDQQMAAEATTTAATAHQMEHLKSADEAWAFGEKVEDGHVEQLVEDLAAAAKPRFTSVMDEVIPVSSKPSLIPAGSREGEFAGEFSAGYEIMPKTKIPSWTYFDQFGEDDEGIKVSVGTESVDPPLLSGAGPKPKMFNVLLGVKPRDIKMVYQTPPWNAKDLKKYDVSVGVNPRDPASQIKKRPSLMRTHEGLFAKEEAGEMFPEELTDAEIQRRQNERIRLLRKHSKRWEAETLARPIHYRDLDLTLPVSTGGICYSAETQVDEYGLERTMAAKRGIILKPANILWPSIREFTTDIGKQKLEDYVRRIWKLDGEWTHVCRFIQKHSTNYRSKYIFEVEFSISTEQIPIPPATARVYFVYELDHYKHLDNTVKVSYCLEGTRYSHIPGHISFNQKWLYSIVADKLHLARHIDF